MKSSNRLVFLVFLALLAACDGVAHGDEDAGSTGGIDAALDTQSSDAGVDVGVCDALTRRTPPAEVFVGPVGECARLLSLFDAGGHRRDHQSAR